MQLYRYQQIHHGIMLVGKSGTGKTSTYKTLLNALERVEKVESTYHVLDAKVMSKEALYGVLDPTTREWSDGIFTATLRKIVENLRGEDKKRHWVVFNGDVDPEWVENLNSVLDDNKVLTLPNGERIELVNNVRIIFEVENLKFATPATVSRCGMIWYGGDIVTADMHLAYGLHKLRNAEFDEAEDEVITAGDITREQIQARAGEIIVGIFNQVNITNVILKSKELSHVMEFTETRIIATFFSLVKSSCFRLHQSVAQIDFPPSEEQLESFITKSIMIALLWAFAGDCSLDDRKVFGEYLLSLTPFVNSGPSHNVESLLDYDVSVNDGSWSPWINQVPRVDLESHSILSTDVVVPTVDTFRHESLIYKLLHDHKPVILCGPPGSGKTMTLFSALRKSQNLDVVGLNFSKATTPSLLIKSLEQHCEYQKTINGTIISPSQIGRWLVVFCDEINLPANDKYGTQRVISLLRQMIEENGFWKEDEKKWVSLSHIQFVGACNPPTDAGRTALPLRFLRHTAVILVDSPGEASLRQIYHTFNSSILKTIPSLRPFSEDLTKAMIEVFLKSKNQFTAEKSSHYIYSPRELTRWCRGIFEAIRYWDELSDEGLVRLWAHEALRLFNDRLIHQSEKDWTWNIICQVASKYFLGTNLQVALKAPLLYSNWLSRTYRPVDQETLRQFIKARMKTFCDEELDTPLVLFEDLLDHVLRIDRVLRQPQGHLILIGVSSSGKTTLSRFVAWMNGIKVHQLKTSRKYGEDEFTADLRNILKRAGCNGEKTCFILDESNILETSFLERMNTLLANGEVPGLFEGDDYATLMTSCKEGAARQGLNLDSSDELYKWFTSEIVRNLHVIFTMNPPDSDLSSHVTTSPALFNRCVINWMGDWSDSSVYELSSSVIDSINVDKSDFKVPPTVKSSSPLLATPATYRQIVLHAIVFIHNSVKNLNSSIKGNVIYSDVVGSSSPVQSKIGTTPGDLIDFIQHFVQIFNEKKNSLEDQQRHFNVGLDKIKGTVLNVRELRAGLAEKKEQLEIKSQQARDMLRQMVSDQNEAERKREASIEIQLALDIQEKEISKRQEVVLRDLARAEPAVIEAQKSVSNIKKQHLTELKSMGNPPEAVKLTLESVCVLLGEYTETWRDVQQYIRRDDFIASIVNFDNETQMTPQLRKYMEQKYLSLPNYNFESVNRASKACGPLLQWVEAQVVYSSILEKVGPLREEVMQLENEALQTKAQAQAISDMIEELEKSIELYKDDYANLITETQTIKSEMTVVEHKVNRSVQLVESLSSEKERWSKSIKEFESKSECLAGNSLLSAAFLAYSGYFDQQVRNHLRSVWHIYLEENGIAFEKSNTVSEYLSSGGQKLKWHDNSLPVDDLCVENAIMIERYTRYPFIIDPTTRIIKFLEKKHENRKLTVTSFLNDSFIKHLESALRFGNPILIQDAEHLDPIITQVLNKEYKKTGGRTLIELGRQDIDFSSDFKLYLLSRDPSVIVPPHISSRTTVINFTITRSSLESQALNMVLKAERPDIEEKRKELVKLQGEYKVHLRQLEINLLQALNDSHGNILDNDAIVDTLESIKVEASEVSKRIEETQSVMEAVEHTMSEYQLLTKHSGMIFALLEKLSLLNAYYQFSLELFLQIMDSILSLPHDKSASRVEYLIKNLYLEIYNRASHTLLKKDKSLLLLLLIQLYTRGFDVDLFQKLKDLPILDLKSIGWFEKAKLMFTGNILRSSDIQEDDALGKLLSDKTDIPDIWTDSITDMEKWLNKLLLIRATVPEKLINVIDDAWFDMFGQKPTKSSSGEDFENIIIHQVSCSTPIALCTAQGTDPTYKVELLCERIKQKFEVIAMGSNEGVLTAERAIQGASREGSWVVLQNLQLSPDWMEGVEKRLKSLQPHSSFRLFFTVPLSAPIPVTLLRVSRILTFEKTSGIKSSMKQTFESIPSSRVSKLPVERARLYYLLSWVHSIMVERLSFIPLGWSKAYNFNDADFESGLFVIDKWIDDLSKNRSNIPPNGIPWKAFKELIVKTIYGGKVDNSEDEKKIYPIVSRAFNEAAYSIGYTLVVGEALTAVPETSDGNSFMQWIERLPERENPQWLGLEADAEDAMIKIECDEIIKNSLRLVDSLVEA